MSGTAAPAPAPATAKSPSTAKAAWLRDWAWRRPQTPAEREDRAAWSLAEESQFRTSVVARARLRLRHQVPVADPRAQDAWRLPGLDRFGDVYDQYAVALENGRYSCSCWNHLGGDYRRRRICSHILTVMMWRRTEDEAGEGVLAPLAAREAEEVAEPVDDADPQDTDESPDAGPRRPIDDWRTPEDLGLPWASFRGVQLLALQRIKASTAKVFVLDAPTGAGKSLIAAASAVLLGMPAVYCAPTIQLQQQFLNALPGLAHQCKGRANYTPLNALPPEPDCGNPAAHDPEVRRVTCEQCDLSYDEGPEGRTARCSFCHAPAQCSYLAARKAAFASQFAVLNTAYWVHEANYAGRFSDLGKDGACEPKHADGLRLFVFDEGDSLESALMAFLEVAVPAAILQQLDLAPPDTVAPTNKLDAWGGWIRDAAIPKLTQRIQDELGPAAALRQIVAAADEAGADPRSVVQYQDRPIELRIARHLYAQARRQVKHLETALGSLQFLLGELQDQPRSWVRTDRQEDGRPAQDLTFRPAHVGRYAEERLWRHGTRFLVMSATILSPDRFCEDLGLNRSDVEYLSLPNMFPRQNRLIHYAPVGSMAFKEQAATLPRMIERLEAIADAHPEDRILVHSVSFRLTATLVAGLSRGHGARVVTFGNLGRDRGLQHFDRREPALAAYTARPASILVGPGLERGIDLQDDLCRVQVIVKVPYPNTQDRQVAQRLYAYGRHGQAWYICQTVRSLVQATGRGNRTLEDWCETWILDEAFGRLLRDGRWCIPGWWLDALVDESRLGPLAG